MDANCTQSAPKPRPGHFQNIARDCVNYGAFAASENWLRLARSGSGGIVNLVAACHGLSYAAGWWHDPASGEPVGSVPEKIALIHSELSEALEADRKGLMDGHLPDRPGIEVELADALIRICDLAGALDLDLAGAVVAKLHYNQSRADHKREARAAGGKAY